MQIQINKLTTEVSALDATQRANHSAISILQDANHKENRKDIHRLFNGQQALVDSVTNGLEKIADRMGDRMSKVESDVVQIKINWAKAVGYVTGISVLGAVVFELVKVVLERTVTK